MLWKGIKEIFDFFIQISDHHFPGPTNGDDTLNSHIWHDLETKNIMAKTIVPLPIYILRHSIPRSWVLLMVKNRTRVQIREHQLLFRKDEEKLFNAVTSKILFYWKCIYKSCPIVHIPMWSNTMYVILGALYNDFLKMILILP